MQYFHDLFNLLLYAYQFFACIYVCILCSCFVRLWDLSYIWIWAAIYRLGTELRTSEKEMCAFKY